MLKYAKIVNEETGAVDVGIGTDEEYYKSIGMALMDVSECNKGWFLTEKITGELEEEKKEEFNKQFFKTSLGYVRREVSMKDGSTRDFLCDILPRLRKGVEILTYTEDLEQNKVVVTDEFINECDRQLLQDFYGE